jgi:uncharacterized membrane protein (DUF2068 family)
VGLLLLFWGWAIWIGVTFHWGMANVLGLTLLAYVVANAIQAGIILLYSDRRWEDFVTCLTLPMYLPYRVLLRIGRTIAVVEEFISRASYRDPFIPEKVRAVARKW